LYRPYGFTYIHHHFVFLNKENKTLRIQVLTIDLGTLFVSFLFHELLIRTDQ